jgi:hypothetical protein
MTMPRLHLVAALLLAALGCGNGAGQREAARYPTAERGPGAAPGGDRPAAETERQVQAQVQRTPRSIPPAPLLCDDPAFWGGELVIGGERVVLPSTCYSLDRAAAGAPERASGVAPERR